MHANRLLVLVLDAGLFGDKGVLTFESECDGNRSEFIVYLFRERFIPVQDENAVVLQVLDESPLLPRERLRRIEEFHMHWNIRDARDDRDIRHEPAREFADIPWPIRAHLQNQPLRIPLAQNENKEPLDDIQDPAPRRPPAAFQPEDGKRHAELRVVAFLALADETVVLRKNGGYRIFRRRLPGAAGHRDYLRFVLARNKLSLSGEDAYDDVFEKWIHGAPGRYVYCTKENAAA